MASLLAPFGQVLILESGHRRGAPWSPGERG